MDPLHTATLVYVGVCVVLGCAWHYRDSRGLDRDSRGLDRDSRGLDRAEAREDAPRLVPDVGQ